MDKIYSQQYLEAVREDIVNNPEENPFDIALEYFENEELAQEFINTYIDEQTITND